MCARVRVYVFVCDLCIHLWYMCMFMYSLTRKWDLHVSKYITHK